MIPYSPILTTENHGFSQNNDGKPRGVAWVQPALGRTSRVCTGIPELLVLIPFPRALYEWAAVLGENLLRA
jgi:hypothetical protein